MEAGTQKEYVEIVRFADEFLRGGTYDLHVLAYSASPVVRIEVASQTK